MSHADVFVCDGDQQQEAGSLKKYMTDSSCVDRLAMY